MTAQLFTPVELGGVTLPNRIVVSPMCQYSAVDGSAQPWHQVHYGMLAMSGAGLLCLEATHVERDGRITQGCLGLYSDENEAAMKPVVDWARAWMPAGQARHPARPCRPQGLGAAAVEGRRAAHPGRRARPAVDDRLGLGHSLRRQVAHAGRPRRGRPEARQAGLRRGDAAQRAAGLRRGRAARRARLSACSQFLSPLSNQRSDEYGGTAEKRRRFPLEVFEACRQVWPRDKAMGMRLSCVEWVEGGVTHRGHDRDGAPAQGAGLRLHRCQLGRQCRGPEDPGRAGLSRRVRGPHPQARPASRPGRSASSPSPSRPSASSPRARPTARRMRAPSCSIRAGAGTPPARWASKRRPCRCRPSAPQPSCRSSLSPSLARAAD